MSLLVLCLLFPPAFPFVVVWLLFSNRSANKRTAAAVELAVTKTVRRKSTSGYWWTLMLVLTTIVILAGAGHP